MEQSWNGFWASVSQVFHQALFPLRAVAEALGLHLGDAQIWCFLCGVFVLTLVGIQTYGDLLLKRRGVVATGKVVSLEKSDEGPDTPIIEFADRRGKTWRFTSSLPVNKTTKSVGASVEVKYDPLRPKRAREVGRSLAKAAYMTLWWTIVAALMTLAFWPGLISD